MLKKLWMYILACTLAVVICPNVSIAKDPKEFKLGMMTSFSGPFASVAETQKKGVLLKVDQINKMGGLNMPWGKIKIVTVVKDDEMKLDVGVRRFRELAGSGIHAMTGTVWNPMAAALNEECKLAKIPYLPGCVPALDSFRKGNPAKGTYSVAFTPWSVGYLVGGSAIKVLGKKRIFFQSRSDSWGSTMYEGLKAACKEYGGEIVGFADVPKGTVDYTAIINKAIAVKPDIFITSMFGGDAIACLKQAHELGLAKICPLFNTWTTNVVARGIPAEVLNGLNALVYYYYGLEGFKDPDLVKRAEVYTNAHMKMWNEPPDAYGTIAYVATDILFQAVEKAGSFDNDKIAEVLSNSKFQTVKGEVSFRDDHQMVGKYMAFLVKGKAPGDKKDKYDVFNVTGFFGGDQALPSLKSLGY